MKHGKIFLRRLPRFVPVGLFVLIGSVAVCAQNSASNSSSSDTTTAAIRDLQQQVIELRQAVQEMQLEAKQYRAENHELRTEVQALQGKSTQVVAKAQTSYGGSSSTEAQFERASPPQVATVNSPPTGTLEERVAALEDSSQLLNSKLDDQYQTKVETGSKYRARLSGLVLLNLFSNRGTTENSDIPSFVIGPNQGHGDFGATVRQSEIGLEVFGPTVAGARTSGSVQADFTGGFPSTWNGVSSGIFRLRTASVRLDWEHTSIVAGQDDLFISPLSPTSFASLAIPAFNYGGNLWAWTPQLRAEHRFDVSDEHTLTLQGAILDNLTGEFPADPYFRFPGPGEQSGQPAYATRIGWGPRNRTDHPLTLGVAGYYNRQDWSFGHKIDGWAGMMDWQVPLLSKWSLSGELYRGRAIGGLNASFGRSVLFNGDPTLPTTSVRGLDTVGGWSQLKFRATPKLEFNAGFGLDNSFASEIRAAEGSEVYVGTLWMKNRAALGNFIYRPRSNLLFSAEYRHLQTFQVDSAGLGAQQINLMMGIFF